MIDDKVLIFCFLHQKQCFKEKNGKVLSRTITPNSVGYFCNLLFLFYEYGVVVLMYMVTPRMLTTVFLVYETVFQRFTDSTNAEHNEN